MAAGLDAGKIDAGAYRLDVSVMRANSFPSDQGRVIAEILDAGSAVIATPFDTGYEAITPEDSWVEHQLSMAPLPAGARAVRLRLLHQRLDGTQSNAAFDAVAASVTDTTAMLQPVFDPTPGAQTIDGTVTFEAGEAWARHGEVTGVTDRTTFAATVTESRAADGWFAGGVLTWETGANAGRSCEVRSWSQAGGSIVLFLPQPFAIAAGDAFRIHPGCDKRLDTCISRFANVLNFRGEPYVPGQDALMSYPDAH